jgi:hypothetical protein
VLLQGEEAVAARDQGEIARREPAQPVVARQLRFRAPVSPPAILALLEAEARAKPDRSARIGRNGVKPPPVPWPGGGTG